jgi:hypothetical protein
MKGYRDPLLCDCILTLVQLAPRDDAYRHEVANLPSALRRCLASLSRYLFCAVQSIKRILYHIAYRQLHVHTTAS